MGSSDPRIATVWAFQDYRRPLSFDHLMISFMNIMSCLSIVVGWLHIQFITMLDNSDFTTFRFHLKHGMAISESRIAVILAIHDYRLTIMWSIYDNRLPKDQTVQDNRPTTVWYIYDSRLAILWSIFDFSLPIILVNHDYRLNIVWAIHMYGSRLTIMWIIYDFLADHSNIMYQFFNCLAPWSGQK